MAAITKQEADAWDRILDAASALSELIESSGLQIDEDDLEELTIFLAANGPTIRSIVRKVKSKIYAGVIQKTAER
ncbi:YebG family protein [Desulfosarcina ovata]|uniref:Uncharacterized protein n=2 Tax=Desulfosarcina ovata TaxID=83564 RepID=A0A5K8ADF6_9BACT|nr:YebG family protein [Desulfosarcina ovata]BBO84142.1 hypothetical protein DSCO28_47080 [Desulfosarcina ovata subsp. sediminis]BBO90652.1 hypothetical protein DSCOOX_38320 [Desulfosarcina ovata subsp. ovata]